jgi:hypothetical protein
MHEVSGSGRHLANSLYERSPVGLRGPRHPAHFTDELERGGMNLGVGCWGLKVGEGFDVSAHAGIFSPTAR